MAAPQGHVSFHAVPGNEIPVSVPLQLELNRNDDLVLWLTDLHVYTTGIEFTVHTRRRLGDRVPDMYGFGKPSNDTASAPYLIGLGYADGTHSSNLPGAANAGGLQHRGGSAGPGRATVTYFRHPLPPDGPIQIVTAWPYFTLPEHTVELDGRLITAAAAHVETLWPPPVTEHVQLTGQHTLHPLDLEPHGWFDTHYAPSPAFPTGNYTLNERTTTPDPPEAVRPPTPQPPT